MRAVTEKHGKPDDNPSGIFYAFRPRRILFP